MRVNKGAGNEREIDIYTKLILEMCLLKSVLDKYSVSEILLPTLPVLNKAKKEILRTKMYSNVHIIFFIVLSYISTAPGPGSGNPIMYWYL